MARDYFVNGETMVAVKGAAGTSISTLTNLGLSNAPIQISLNYIHMDIGVDAWGGEGRAPPEIQSFLADAQISMTLVHFDRAVLDECLRLSMGGGLSVGQFPRAGARMGKGLSRFAAGMNFMGLNLYSPVSSKPWRFYYSYLTSPPMVFPIGTERSLVQLNWRAVPYTIDPWNDGSGASHSTVVLFDHTLDT